jgi:hypothetical protein
MIDQTKSLLHCPKCNEEFPAQGRERYKHILDTVRANQNKVLDILTALVGDEINDEVRIDIAKWILKGMHGMDRDAILQSGGILTDEQIELLR